MFNKNQARCISKITLKDGKYPTAKEPNDRNMFESSIFQRFFQIKLKSGFVEKVP
jgi:hypothetical protein